MELKKLLEENMGLPNKILAILQSGSDAFGLNMDKSDNDLVVIYLPTNEDLLHLRKIKNKVSFTKDGVEYDVKYWDVRDYINLLRKFQVEIISSYVVNPLYTDEMFHWLFEETLLTFKEDFLNGNPYEVFATLLGLVKSRLDSYKRTGDMKHLMYIQMYNIWYKKAVLGNVNLHISKQQQEELLAIRQVTDSKTKEDYFNKGQDIHKEMLQNLRAKKDLYQAHYLTVNTYDDYQEQVYNYLGNNLFRN